MYPQTTPLPSQRPAGWAIALGVVSAGFLIGALLFAALAVVGIGHDARLNSHGVTTTATVTDCDGTEVVVDFTTQDGERVSGDYISWPNQVSPAVGDRVEITYDSTDPTYIVAAGSAEDRLLGIGFTGAAVVAGSFATAAGAGALLVHRGRRRQVLMFRGAGAG
ncbi:hypothetical protein SAMN04489835_1596 [Mycolicibacterium rutilum]|uniref:DUF3592 domain-containing protein n=1 Tax=Mycolicibacterium rutilum TaxID=370526 RepID=A0A1H6JEQ6_MYCRU|nr:DUF3592 domain-containing protein [Mycolicibacterium rutilum]SEH57351.1 hypothetical protein SAMN04489835_1596 [Mycolicibacterium rutilum]